MAEIGNFTASPSASWNCSSTHDGKLHLHRPRSDDHRPGAGTSRSATSPDSRALRQLRDRLARPVVGCDRTQSRQQFLCVHVGTGPRVDLKITKTGPVKVPGCWLSPYLDGYQCRPPSTCSEQHRCDRYCDGIDRHLRQHIGNASRFLELLSVRKFRNLQLSRLLPVVATGQALGTITITYHSPALANFTNCARVGLTSNAPLQELTLTNNQACVTVSDIKIKVVVQYH